MRKKTVSIDYILIAAIVFGLIIRLILWKTTRFMISFDAANYLRLAGHAVQTDLTSLLHPYWSPFYPFMIRLMSIFSNNLEAAARLVSIFSGVGLIPLVYTLTLKLFSRSEARVAAVIMALFPSLVYESTAAMPESIYTLTGLAGIILAWHMLSSKKWIFGLFAGVCWGLAYLTKPEGIGFLFVWIGFMALWFIINRKSVSIRRAILYLSVCVVAFTVITMPYLIFLRQNTGKWTISTKGTMNQQMEAAVVFNDGPVKDPFFHLTSDRKHLPYDMGMHFGTSRDIQTISGTENRMVKISLSKYVVKYIKNMHKLTRESIPQIFGLWMIIPLVLGFFSSRYSHKKGFLIFILLFFCLFWFIVVPLFHVNIRYLTPLLPLTFMWIGAGFIVMVQWIRDILNDVLKTPGLQRTVPTGIIVLFFTASVLIPEYGRIFRNSRPGTDLWDQPVELKQASEWLKSHASGLAPRLMTLNKAIDFYAGQYDMKQGGSFSYDSVKDNILYARHRQCDFLVFSSRYLQWFGNLQPLVDDKNPPGLDRVYDRKDTYGIRTVIFKLQPEEQ